MYIIRNIYTYKVSIISLIMKFKKHLNLSVDGELAEEAKKNYLNISEIAEDAIKEALGKKELVMDITIEECDFCSRKMEKATAKNPNIGMIWLWPDEKWICPKCLRNKSDQLIKSYA